MKRMEENKMILEELKRINERLDTLEAKIDKMHVETTETFKDVYAAIMTSNEIAKEMDKKLSDKLDKQIKEMEIVLNQNCKDITYLRAIK